MSTATDRAEAIARDALADQAIEACRLFRDLRPVLFRLHRADVRADLMAAMAKACTVAESADALLPMREGLAEIAGGDARDNREHDKATRALMAAVAAAPAVSLGQGEYRRDWPADGTGMFPGGGGR